MATEIRPEEHLGLVASELFRRFPHFRQETIRDTDEWQDGCLGLVLSAPNYDPTKGKWSSYATRSIQHAVRSGLQVRACQGPGTKRKRWRAQESASQIFVQGGTGSSATRCFDLGVIADRRDDFAIRDARIDAAFLLKKLDKRARRLLWRWCQGYTFDELAGTEGVTKQAVQQLVGRTLNKLRLSVKQ